MAGVVGACVLGATLGLWARPAQDGGPPLPPGSPVAPPPALQIVVDDEPGPAGALLEVLPGKMATLPQDIAQPPPDEAPAAATSPVEPEARPPAAIGLMKVDTPVAPEPLLVAPAQVEAKPALKPVGLEKKPGPKAKPKVAALEVKPGPKARPAKLEPADAGPAKAHKPSGLHAQQGVRTKAPVVEPAKTAKLARAEKTQAAKLSVAEEKRGKSTAAHRKRIAELNAAGDTHKIVRAEPRRAASARLAEAKPTAVRPAAKNTERSLKVERAKAPPAPPTAKPPARRGAGPLRVAGANTCDSADASRSMACAETRLSARDRQLQQAYRNAEAAGVSATALHRQQARWLQARAAAAREAPWAVEDVYEAQMSELNDLTRDAKNN